MAIYIAYWSKLNAAYGNAPKYGYADYTSDCETRDRGYVDYFIIHHTATTSESGAIALMQPGDSREVSAQWVLGTDGEFHPVVPLNMRAWTSASWLDDIADTVETVNLTSGPAWEISDLAKLALAHMAVWKFRNGRLKSLTRTHIIGHYEVLGISGDGYATACPGPDMQLDLIVELANAIYNGTLTTKKEEAMSFKLAKNTKGTIEFRDEFGVENLGAYGTGLTNAQIIAAAADTWGIEDTTDGSFDVGRQLTNRRNTQIATARKAELAAVLGPLVDAAVAKAFETVVIPPAEPIDYAALAKAVNDDLHARTAE